MSGLAVCWNLDGAPLSPATLAVMTAATPHRGPDGVGHWVNGAIGLGHCLLATTPESVGERQPLVEGPFALTFDGRLDNRRDLIHLLRPDPLLDAPVVTDTALVLLAYRRWGTAVTERLLGDFAFALWDGQARRVFCARDPLGKKPLYYFHDGRRFVAGSEPRQLLATALVPRTANLGMIAEFVACSVTHPEETLFDGIRRLRAGHSLVATPASVVISRYWSPQPIAHNPKQGDGEYADAFLDLFKTAVRCRLRTPGPVGCELSGGVDSTSVAGTVRLLQREGLGPAAHCETFSMLFPGLPCDETPYIDAAVAFIGLPATRVTYGTSSDEEPSAAPECPWYPNGTAFNPVARASAAKGIRVTLTGHGGDEWLMGSYFHLADSLASLRLSQAARQLWALRDVHGSGVVTLPAMPLYHYGLVPLVPRWARRLARRFMQPSDDQYTWLTQKLKASVGLGDRIRATAPQPHLPTHAQRDIVRTALAASALGENEMSEHLHARFGIEHRHPFDDVRVVEWALGLPEDQRWRGNETKVVLRNAMRGRIPESVRVRRSKAEFSVVVVHALTESLGSKPFAVPALESMGLVDGPELKRMYERMRTLCATGEQGYSRLAWPLWAAYAADRWFDTVFLGNSMHRQRESKWI